MTTSPSAVKAGFNSLCWLLFVLVAPAAAGDRFSGQVVLGDGRIVLVAEGEGEPRSIGSYSVRLYSGANPQFPFDDFMAGRVDPRDGFVQGLKLADLDGDGRRELVVIVRNAGTGGYLSAQGYRLHEHGIEVVGRVENLGPGEDPVAHLREAFRWQH